MFGLVRPYVFVVSVDCVGVQAKEARGGGEGTLGQVLFAERDEVFQRPSLDDPKV